MKRFITITLILSLSLTSCSLFRSQIVENPLDSTSDFQSENTIAADTTVVETTEADTTEKEEVKLPCLMGFYDDLQDNGTYTRLAEWKAPWIVGRDIAVFDIIPSTAETLSSPSYKRLWNEEENKNFPDSEFKPWFILEYTLNDGTSEEITINGYEDAQKVTDNGYLEIYLYDDIHQEEGAWYYHLTKDTTTENTVISSVKLTAGKLISSVTTIRLTAFDSQSGACSIEVKCGN